MIRDIMISIILVVCLFMLGFSTGKRAANHEQPTPINVSVDSMDAIKLNHLIQSVDAIDLQQDALEQNVQDILTELVKIRKEIEK